MVANNDESSQGWNSEDVAERVSQATRVGNWQSLKEALAEVAESNYKSRAEFPPPKSRMVGPVCLKKKAATPKNGWPMLSMSQMDPIEAARFFGENSEAKVCVLVDGHGCECGGTYRGGGLAQEEEVCRRCPAHFGSLLALAKMELYPFGPSTYDPKATSDFNSYSHVIYTPGVVVARDSRERGYAWLPPEKRMKVSLVTACHPKTDAPNNFDAGKVRQTVTSIFRVPKEADPHTEVLVIGGWGCGFSGANAESSAGFFAQALTQERLGSVYRAVHFAIPSHSYAAFRNIFKQFKLKVGEL